MEVSKIVEIRIGRELVPVLNLNAERQTFDYDCGAKALQAYFAWNGEDVREDRLMRELKTTKKDGTLFEEMVRVSIRHGYKVVSGRMTLDAVKKYIDKEIPVLVMVQAWRDKKDNRLRDWLKDWRDGHWVIVIGYTKDKIVFEDPASIKRTWMKEKEFLARWHDLEGRCRYENCGIVLLGKAMPRTEAEHMD
jgi:predicted double-glycine peptidase